MADVNYTPQQLDAVEANGGSIIVSAAAGSGKTRVLVERVTRKLTDPKKPVDADRFLIVTFTRAAAAEMKMRIAVDIDDLLRKNPDSTLLRRQQMLLSNADICTAHGFCSKIIKENFFMLDISRDFRILSDSEADVIKHDILSELIEEQYASGDEAFIRLSTLLAKRKNDRNMEKALLTLYDNCNSHPFPYEWLRASAAQYHPELSLSSSEYAAFAYAYGASCVDYAVRLLSEIEKIVYDDNNEFASAWVKSKARNLYDYYDSFFMQLDQKLHTKSWNTVSGHIRSFSEAFEQDALLDSKSRKLNFRSPSKPKPDKCTDAQGIIREIELVKSGFEIIKGDVVPMLGKLFLLTEEQFREDMEYLYPAVCCLCSMMEEFDKRFFEEKKERGVLDYSDLEHLMLRLLVTREGDRLVRTDFAKMLSERYDEIMVDEYQDTNATQKCIYSAISKDDSNIFVVGDAKQSIYRFRYASPEIFLRQREESLPYDRNDPQFPARIILDKNFRSADGVIDSINYIFETLMSRLVGEIEYNEEEKLKVGAKYELSDAPSTEFHIINACGKGSELTAREQEAEYIAALIRRMTESRDALINSKDKNGEMHLDKIPDYSDICILMRNLAGAGETYAEILNRNGIPAYINRRYSLFNCREVNTALSVLRILDNPLQEIPMIAALMCPVFGFTPNDLSVLKNLYPAKYTYSRLFACVNDEKADEDLQQKCRFFLNETDALSTLSVTLSTGRLLSAFFERTGFLSVVSAMDNGGLRMKNLRKFLGYIREYESGGQSSLSSFIRHVDFLEEHGTDITAEDTAPANAVRIMTIHRSKGLEFPICILANLESEGDKTPDDIVCHPVFGIGLRTIEKNTMLKFNTLQRNIILQKKSEDERSEAMRLLYVAATRAKEKLIPVITISSTSEDGFTNKLKKIAAAAKIEDGRILSYEVNRTSKLSDWLLMCAMVHPDFDVLREMAESDPAAVIPTKARWKCVIADQVERQQEQSSEAVEAAEPDKELSALLESRFGQHYRYEARTSVPAKVSASALTHSDMLLAHVADSRPAFMQTLNMTGAEKGTAMHAFLQFVDFALSEQELASEMKRVFDEGYLTKEQYDSLDADKLRAFFKSRVYAHIKSALCLGEEHLLREFRFTVNISARDVDDSAAVDDSVILQGAMDCVAVEEDGITIIDYKTDKVSSASMLAQRYRKQLCLYKKAAEQLFDLPVKQCMIYSVYCGEDVEVEV